MRLYRVADYVLPDHDGRDRLGQNIRSPIVALKNGGFDQDGQQLVFQPNRLSRNVTIISTEDIDQTLFDLTRQMGRGRQLLGAKLDDNTTEWHTWGKLTRLSKDANADKWNCEYAIGIEWIQDYPFWINTANDSSYADMGLFTDDGELADDGQNLHLTGTASNAALAVTDDIDNTGSYPIYRIFITIVCDDYVDSPMLINETNGFYIRYNGTLNAGEILTIDCLSKTAYIDATGNVYGDIEIGSNQMEWMKLELDTNVLTYSTSMTNDDNHVYIQWAEHYI